MPSQRIRTLRFMPRRMIAFLLVALLLAGCSLWRGARTYAQTTPPEETTTLQGGVTSLRVTKGRSQIIKFAQPIPRVSIADPALAEVVPLGPDEIMIHGKARGVTSFIVWDENGQEGIFDLYVENDTSELLKAIGMVAPNEKIQARVTDDSFILSGQVSNSVILDEIRRTAAAYGYRDKNFIDLTESPVPQVYLEVKIAETNKSTARQIKTSFSTDSGNSLSLTRLGQAIDDTVLTAVGRTTQGLVPLRPIRLNQAGTNAGGITGAFSPFGENFQAAWDLLETEGKITVLAEPTLVCTHGRTASFLAGGEFPFVASTDQNGSPIIQFKDFGVKLNFTPWIAIRSKRIEVKVEPEVSSLDTSSCVTGAGGTQVCGLLKRTTSTTVELEDGESLMISGILTREERNTMSKVPFAGDLPILGGLFRNTDNTKVDKELIVVVTPRIVKQGDYGHILGRDKQALK
ncbi:MAG: type II and III secretion system protein family protein [Candidatus Melainabacteria bacterium]